MWNYVIILLLVFHDGVKLREAAKKKVHPLLAGPLRGGVKAGPLRKKELFLKLFFYFVAI